MPGVQLDGIAKAMLPRLPSREWRLLGETNDGFGSIPLKNPSAEQRCWVVSDALGGIIDLPESHLRQLSLSCAL